MSLTAAAFGARSCCYCTRPHAAFVWPVEPFAYLSLSGDSVRAWDVPWWQACLVCRRLEVKGRHERLVAFAADARRQMDPLLDEACQVDDAVVLEFRMFLEQQFAAARAAFTGPSRRLTSAELAVREPARRLPQPCSFCFDPAAAWLWVIESFTAPRLLAPGVLPGEDQYPAGYWYACQRCRDLQIAGEHGELVRFGVASFRAQSQAIEQQCAADPSVELALFTWTEQLHAAARRAFVFDEPDGYHPGRVV